MGARQRVARQRVDRAGQPLRQPPAVDEDQRRAVFEHQFEQPRVDRRPDRRPHRPLRRRPARDLDRLAELRHVLDRHLDAQRELLLLAGLHDRDRPPRGAGAAGVGELVVHLQGGRAGFADPLEGAAACGPHAPRRSTAEEPRHFVERTLRRRQSDPLQGRAAECLEALQRQRQVGAALGRHQRVDLVDDHGVHRSQRGAGLRGEQQVQGFRGRDEDVRGFAYHARAVGRGRVAGADADPGRQVGFAAAGGHVGDADERRAEVALHVHRQRLERGHVQHPAAVLLRRLGREHHALDRPQERGQRLAAAGGRQDQRGLTARDRRPAERLGSGGLAERAVEPFGHRGMEQTERVGAFHDTP